MNSMYTKTVLYAFPLLDKIIERIDDVIECRAMSSMDNYEPCFNQAERIVIYSMQKMALLGLKMTTERLINSFTKANADCVEYKYFKRKDKEYFKDFDYTSRNYFRKQTKIVELLCVLFEKHGYDDARFEQDFLSIPFMRDLYYRTRRHERLMMGKHKGKKENALSPAHPRNKPDIKPAVQG